MNAIRFICFIGIGAGLLVTGPRSLAQQRFLLPDDPEKAWEDVEKMHEALRRPVDWENRQPSAEEVTKFQKQIRESAMSFAEKAREFIKRFPADENIGDARITVVWALTHAVAAGETNAEAQVTAFRNGVLADKEHIRRWPCGCLLLRGQPGAHEKSRDATFHGRPGKAEERVRGGERRNHAGSTEAVSDCRFTLHGPFV
jgi:hypothetical protein